MPSGEQAERTHPHAEVELSDALPEARFALARARVAWSPSAESIGWGRSTTAEVAMRKAIGEAVERHACMRLPSGARRAAAAELERWLPPDQLIGHAPGQYAQPGFAFKPFSEADTYLWVPAQPVEPGPPTWVVADAVRNPRAFSPGERERLLTHANTSGCATAPTLEQAITLATLELVERDAFMRHWFAQQGGVPVTAESLPHGLGQRIAWLRSQGCSAGVQCLGLGWHPVWLAWAQHERLHFTSIGLATGLEAEPALEAALSEMETQALPRLSELPLVAIEPEQVRSPADHAALYATPRYFRCADALGFSEAAAAEAGASYREIEREFALPVQALYRRLGEAGHPVHWIDLSLPSDELQPLRRWLDEPRLHTVRAVAPGLIPLSFGHGRLPLAFDTWQRPGGHFIHPFA